MARNWQKLQDEFAIAHRQTGISVVQWCANNGLNYHTARRHIKVKLRSAAHNVQAPATPKDKTLAQAARDENKTEKTAVKTKQPRKGGALFGNRNAMKHGGYSKAVVKEIHAIAQSNGLTEIGSITLRIYTVLKEWKRLNTLIATGPDTTTLLRLLDRQFKVSGAVDRLIARKQVIAQVESTAKLNAVKQLLREAKAQERDARAGGLAAKAELRRAKG